MTSFIRERRTGACLLVAWTFAACSPGAVEISQSASDPSNPKAPEAVAPPRVVAPPMANGAGAASGDPGGHSGHAGHSPAAPGTDGGAKK